MTKGCFLICWNIWLLLFFKWHCIMVIFGGMSLPFYLKMYDADQNARLYMIVKTLNGINSYSFQYTSWYTSPLIIHILTQKSLYFSLKSEIA